MPGIPVPAQRELLRNSRGLWARGGEERQQPMMETFEGWILSVSRMPPLCRIINKNQKNHLTSDTKILDTGNSNKAKATKATTNYPIIAITIVVR